MRGMESQRKGTKRLRDDMKPPREVEIECMRDEMQRTASGLVLQMAIFVVQLFVPQRRHVLLPNLICLAILVILELSTGYLLKTSSGYHQTKRAQQINSAIHHTGRTLGHITWIVCANEDALGRLGFLFAAPCSATRHSRHCTLFIAYLVTHVGLTFWRFAGSLAEDWPSIVISATCCRILYEISVTGRRAEESALEKSRLMVTLTEDIAGAVLECFCDATARVSEGLEILQDSPSLSTLLSRRVLAGRSFTDFMHFGDRETYRECIRQHQLACDETYTSGGAGEVDRVTKLLLWSTDVHLEDSMSITIEANIFHARLADLDEQPFYLIGISEREYYMHSQERKKKKASAAGRGARKITTRLPSLDFESGRLAPPRPTFSQKDLEQIETLRRSYVPDGAPRGPRPTSLDGRIGMETEANGHPEGLRRTRRPGSPRPRSADSRTWPGR